MDKLKIRIVIWIPIILLYALTLFYLKSDLSEVLFIRVCVISSLALFLLQIRQVVKISSTLISPCLIYLGLYYLFQNGLLLLTLFDTEYNSFYLNYFQLYIKEATLFASISNLIAGFACLLVYKNKKIKNKYDRTDSLVGSSIANSALKGFIFTGLIAIPLIFLKTTVALQGGYSAVRTYEETIPFIFNFLEYMFMPFAVLSLLYNVGPKQRIVFVITVIWLLLTAYCGDRTTGLSGILIIAVINFKQSIHKKHDIRSYVKIGLVLVLLAFFVQLFSILRSQGEVSDMGENENAIVHLLGELGFSSITLFSMMDIVPRYEGFLYGTGYLASLVSGFLPASLDPTGTVANLVKYRDVNDQWMQKYFDFDFGFGFSLNSEAYINFGWYGLIVLLLVNYVVLWLLNYSSRRLNASKFDSYVTYILLFLWCTLPRRDSYYIWKAIMYGVILIRWYILLTSKKTASNVSQ